MFIVYRWKRKAIFTHVESTLFAFIRAIFQRDQKIPQSNLNSENSFNKKIGSYKRPMGNRKVSENPIIGGLT